MTPLFIKLTVFSFGQETVKTFNASNIISMELVNLQRGQSGTEIHFANGREEVTESIEDIQALIQSAQS